MKKACLVLTTALIANLVLANLVLANLVLAVSPVSASYLECATCGPNGGYCPIGTCGPRGAKRVFNIKNCRPRPICAFER
jgi:hypothetical protein